MENKLTRICLHWSVGQYTPNPDDLAHYHYLLDDKGVIHNGNKPPESNLPSNVEKGDYTAHLGGGNSGTIGVSLASMLGYVDRKNMGKFPFTEIQFNNACKLIASLCKKYGIQVTPSTVFSHYEFGKLHPQSPSGGKIDITVLPFDLSVQPDQVGDYIRNKVKSYM